MDGATDWRATIGVRKKVADILIESNLQGIASGLPAPLTKTATDAVPFRFEKIVAGPQLDHLLLSYGNVVSAQLWRRRDPARSAIERGTIAFGGTPPAPER